PNRPLLEIYHLNEGLWEKIQLNRPIGGFQDCINGTVRGNYITWCDVVACSPGIVNYPSEYEWDMKVFEIKEGLCENETYTYHEKVDVSPGTYKAKYGMAEAVFNIQ
ncbi:MAG: hypothetical protein V3U72_00470, partial [Candidatus Aenigmarchaeota archaeon]